METTIQQKKIEKSWSISIIVLTIASIFIVTYQFSFQHIVTLTGSVIIYLIDLFFIINYIIRIRFNKKIGTKKSIKINYISDFLSTLPIDALFLLWPEFSIQGISLVLWLRLLRLFRLKYVFSAVNFLRYQIRVNPGYFRIAKFFIAITIIAHIVSCIWYLSAYFSGFPEKSWVRISEIYNADSLTSYIRSVYWTVTTLTTVGYGDITPHLNYEYLLSIGVMASGAVIYAFIIGNIASILSNLDSQKALFRSKVDSIYINLQKRGISEKLNNRIRNYYEYIWLNHRGFDSYNFLKDLPDSLRLEVMHQLTKELLEEIPIFKHSSSELRNILLMSLKAKTFDPGSIVAKVGHKSKEIFFISKGKIEIENPEKKVKLVLENGDYFGDISLLTGEPRTANAIAKDFCEIFELQFPDFLRIKDEYPEFRKVLKEISSYKSDKTAKMILDGIVL